MSKIRVHELAQKMGIENKELIVRLKAIGVEISNHMAAIDEDVAKKLQAPATVTMTVKDVAQEETRVSSTVIRRRAKVVEKVVEVSAEEAQTVAAAPEIPEAAAARPVEPDQQAVEAAKEKSPAGITGSQDSCAERDACSGGAAESHRKPGGNPRHGGSAAILQAGAYC